MTFEYENQITVSDNDINDNKSVNTYQMKSQKDYKGDMESVSNVSRIQGIGAFGTPQTGKRNDPRQNDFVSALNSD